MKHPLAEMVGVKQTGGCEDCDAYQRVEQDDPNEPMFLTMRVYHDDSCPWLKERNDG